MKKRYFRNGTAALGREIAKARRDAGLTQEELGRLLGVSLWAVVLWERGEYLPSPALAAALRETLRLAGEPAERIGAEELGGIVRECRVRAGLTQAELSELSGVSARGIRRIESGAVTPTCATLGLILGAIVRECPNRAEAERCARPLADIYFGNGGTLDAVA